MKRRTAVRQERYCRDGPESSVGLVGVSSFQPIKLPSIAPISVAAKQAKVSPPHQTATARPVIAPSAELRRPPASSPVVDMIHPEIAWAAPVGPPDNVSGAFYTNS